ASCSDRAGSRVDVDAVRSAVASELEEAFAGRSDTSISGAFGPASLSDDLRALAELRADAVCQLVERARTEAGIRVRFVDQATIAGDIFRTGRPGSHPSAFDGWQYGLHYDRLGRIGDGFGILGYLAGAEDLARHLDAYAGLGLDAARIEVVLRTFPPDVD